MWVVEANVDVGGGYGGVGDGLEGKEAGLKMLTV